MSRLFGPVRQIGYVSRDVAQSMCLWHDHAGVGPWFRFDTEMDISFAGQRSKIDVAIAFANSGGMQIELIEQRNDAPSAFRRALEENSALQIPHHYAFWPDDYDQGIADAARLGMRVIQEVHVSRGRVTYWQAQHPDAPIVELSEYSETRQRTRDLVAAAAAGWNGDDPFRRLG